MLQLKELTKNSMKESNASSTSSDEEERSPIKYRQISSDNLKCRAGGVSTIPLSMFEKSCCYFHHHLNKDLIPAIINLKTKIMTDPLVRMNFNDSILKKMPLHYDK